MQQTFNECTCCYKPLTTEEMEKNEKYDNIYYTICDECVEKYTDRLLKILTVSNKK